MWLANAGELGPEGEQVVYRFKACSRTVLKDSSKERETWDALAMQGTPFCPPEDILRVQIGFAMTNVSAIGGSHPEAVNHFLGREVPPVWRDIALVAALIDDDRLAELFTPEACLLHVQQPRRLNACMRDPGPGVVIKHKAVVD